MTISRLVKVVSTVAVLSLTNQVLAAGEDDHIYPVTTSAEVDTALANLAANVAAGKISGGLGVNYVGRFIYDDAMAKVDFKKTFPVELSVVNNATDGFPGFSGDSPSEVMAITSTKSMGWNDTASNPDVKGATDIEKDGFGWGHNSSWYLVDLSKLVAGNYYVSVKVERYSDGTHEEYSAVVPAVAEVKNAEGVVTTAGKAEVPAKLLPSDDNLVPALSVFNGYQNRGKHMHWYPNKFQTTTTPFWAEMLTPANEPQVTKGKITYGLLGLQTGKAGFDTAFGKTANDIAQVSGVIKLDKITNKTDPAKTNRYLTVALGGDDRIPTAKHDVNYKITVKVHKK